MTSGPEEAFAAFQAQRAQEEAQNRVLTPRQREQVAQARAQMMVLQRQQQEALENREMPRASQIAREMEKLAARETERQQRNAAYAQLNAPVPGGFVRTPPGMLTEGQTPASLTGYESAERVARQVQERKQRLNQAWLALPTLESDLTAEAGRQSLGDAIQMAVTAGTITELQALRMVAIGGLNQNPFSASEMRTLLFDLLVQATQSQVLGLSRARMIAQMIEEAPKNVNEGPEITVPAPDEAVDADGLRALALKTLGVTRSPLTPNGLALAQDALVTLARAVPNLVDRIDRLETTLYEALKVLPCHQGHEIHLQTPTLCGDQASNQLKALVLGLGLDSRALPRDVHRTSEGERAPCCAADGRIGTWLVYGQYLNPELGSSRNRRQVGSPRQQKARQRAIQDQVPASELIGVPTEDDS